MLPQITNMMGHIQAAKLLLPYREIIVDIANNPDIYRDAAGMSYEDYVEFSKIEVPNSTWLPLESFETMQRMFKLFSYDLLVTRGYIALMDVIESYPEAV